MSNIQKMCTMLMLLAMEGLCPEELRAESYGNLWKKVEKAEKESLPQTVIDLTSDIMTKAMDERNAGQMMKAYMCRKEYRERLDPDNFHIDLTDMEQWAQEDADPVNRAVVHSLLAEQYADYMSENGYSLRGRAELDVREAPDDMREWTANLFVAKVDSHTQAALQDEDILLKTENAAYKPFVVQGDDSKFYGHDMFHLLCRRAIDVYRVMAESGDRDLCRGRVGDIHRRMAEAYASGSGGKDAALMAALDYWDWTGEAGRPMPLRIAGKVGRSRLEQLDSLIEVYGDRKLCAEAYIRKAEALRGEQRMAEALATCEEGLRRYPSYKRIGALKETRDAILHPSLRINVPSGAYPGDSLDMRVRHSNLEGLTVEIYSTTFTEVPEDGKIDSAILSKYARKASSTHYALTPQLMEGRREEDAPYLQSDTTLAVPLPDTTGVLILRVVADGKGHETDEAYLVTTRFKVLTLDLGNGSVEMTTLDARSGHPIGGAQITLYERNAKQPLTTLVTDGDGRAVFPTATTRYRYVARKGSDVSMRPVSLRAASTYRKDGVVRHVRLLTDRSLYRPGQTVYVKGYDWDQEDRDARVLESRKHTLTLRDANNRKLSDVQVVTNGFGTFTAEFTLPTTCLNGEFSVRDSEGAVTRFHVEEYKRPTFEITFGKITEPYALGDTVTLRGNVKALNGRSVQDVPLTYTVRRRLWWDTESLLSDSVLLDAEGNFAIPLTLSAPEADDDDEDDDEEMNEGLTSLVLFVDVAVTSEAGETQTARRTLRVEPTPCVIGHDVPAVVCKEDGLARTFTLGNRDGVSLDQPISCVLTRDGEAVLETALKANAVNDLSAWRPLPSGRYRMTLCANGVTEESDVVLFSKEDTRLDSHVDIFLYKEEGEFDEGQSATFLFGTSHKDAYVLMDVFCNHRRLESRILHIDDSITRFEFPYKEEYGDGVTILFSLVKNGTLHQQDVMLEKRQPSRRLDVRWETFRDRLRPGQQEEWRLVVRRPDGTPAEAELLALMYDASLDQLYRRSQSLTVLFRSHVYSVSRDASSHGGAVLWFDFPGTNYKYDGLAFDYFHSSGPRLYGAVGMVSYGAAPNVMMKASRASLATADSDGPAMVAEDVGEEETAGETTGNGVPPRSNFAETAFFQPQLRTDAEGGVAIAFTIPESLTRWNFLSYAHTRDMMVGTLDATATTSKDFMLQPNLPRFVRVGDRTQVAATLSNLMEGNVKGTVTLTLFDPATEAVLETRKQPFAVGAGRNEVVTFDIQADDSRQLLGVRLVADGGTFSDGEQHILPVLSNKQFVTETLAMPIRGGQTRAFALDSLFNRNSATATQRRLTIEFTGNPAWYAVQALPALSQPRCDNATAWATSLYANMLAAHIANSQPRVKAVYDAWREEGGNSETMLSHLRQNEDLKDVLFSETPWLMEATTEEDRMERMATLFDLNAMAGLNTAAVAKLKALQLEDGSWSWYKGMDGNRCMTDYITKILVRLPLLTGEALPSHVAAMRKKAFAYLHAEALDDYKDLLRMEKEGAEVVTLSAALMDYLYMIAVGGETVPTANKEAYGYFLSKVPNNLQHASMRCKAQSAVILRKAGRTGEADAFLASLREHLVREDGMGAHFAFNDSPYAWYTMPVPTHVAVMEALQQTGADDALVEEMKIWLLKQKQTTTWDSPVAAADAIYALLCQGSDLLADGRGKARITIGRKVLDTTADTATAGLGYVRETFTDDDPTVREKTIVVEKAGEGIAWGAAYAQFLTPMSEVSQHGGELNVEKRLYVERVAADGKRSLKPLDELTADEPLCVGDKVVSRMTISLDRAMDFLQLKDGHAACMEPVGTLSGYRWGSGFGYYVEVEDASTNFFFDHLGKGKYVLECAYRVDRAGQYDGGLATVQCAYAPEFTSHSASTSVEVR